MKKTIHYITTTTLMFYCMFFSVTPVLMAQETESITCAAIDAGGGDDSTVEASCDIPCVMLDASFLDVGSTDTYIVESIPYAPYEPLGTDVQIEVSSDDWWADDITDLPFEFCFYGEVYDQMLIGPNGMVTFDLVNNTAGTGSGWAFTTPIPDSDLILAAIFGPMMDININVEGSSNVTYSVRGEEPCRVAVVSYTGIPYFSCVTTAMTTQILLFEGTNIIEVHLRERYDTCDWNSGNAVLGIQNQDGTQGLAAPGRNTGNWEALEEAWRFVPDGTNTGVSFEWMNSDGEVISTNPQFEVCPTETKDYTAKATYVMCNGDIIEVFDAVTVVYDGTIELTLGADQEICAPTYEIVPQILGADPQNVDYTWSNGETTSTITVSETGEYTVDAFYDGCITSSTVYIEFTGYPEFTDDWNQDLVFCDQNFQTTLVATPKNLTSLTGTINYAWYHDGVQLSETGSILAITEPGEYTAVVSIQDCENTAIINVSVADYTVDLGPDMELCDTDMYEISAGVTGIDPADATYLWNTGETTQNITVTDSGVYNVEVSYLDCVETDEIEVIMNELPEVDLGADFEICEGFTAVISAQTTGTANFEYIWYRDGGVINGENSSSLEINGEGTYSVEVGETGLSIDCYGTDQVEISYYDNRNCIIPQGLSPNQDGLNDCFDLAFLSDDPGIVKISIFNRYGTQIYEKENYTNEWCGQYKEDGDTLPVGTYYYVIELRDGSSLTGYVYLNY